MLKCGQTCSPRREHTSDINWLDGSPGLEFQFLHLLPHIHPPLLDEGLVKQMGLVLCSQKRQPPPLLSKALGENRLYCVIVILGMIICM